MHTHLHIHIFSLHFAALARIFLMAVQPPPPRELCFIVLLPHPHTGAQRVTCVLHVYYMKVVPLFFTLNALIALMAKIHWHEQKTPHPLSRPRYDFKCL